jgi:signal transduction histidine kinase/ligand-binding sensor domain-containing protein
VGDGLPNNNVTGVVQTPDGYLWVATRAGLARFDGVRFQLVPVTSSTGEVQPMVRAILHARDDSVWVASEWGQPLVARCATTASEFYSESDGLPSSKPLALAQTPDHAIWVGYEDGSVLRLHRKTVRRFAGGEAGLPDGEKARLTTDLEGRLWFVKASTVGLWTGDGFEACFTVPEQSTRLAPARDGGVWILSGRSLFKADAGAGPVAVAEIPAERRGIAPSAVHEDRAGGLWLGTEIGGLFHWDGQIMRSVKTSHNDIESIMDDREGNTWVGSRGGGLNRLRQRVLEVHDDSIGLPFAAALSVCETVGGELWAVGANGTLTFRVNDRWQEVPTGHGWSGTRATCVVSDRQGGVWIGSASAKLFHARNGSFESLRRKDGLAGDRINALFVDNQTNLWLGLEAPNCLQRLSGDKWTTLNQPAGSRAIRAMAEDHAGNLWCGTEDGLLLRVTPDGLVNDTSRALQPTLPIRALHATKDGSLWIGYAGGGVGRMLQGRFAQIGTREGLLDNTICGIESDALGSMWFATERGIFQVRRRELDALWDGEVQRVAAVDCGANDGLPDLQGNYGCWPNTLLARDGRCWFATRSGLVAAYPGRAQPNQQPPLVVIERLLVDGQPWERDRWESRLQLPPGVRRLDVEFTALSFAAPESVLFQTRLAGWDEDWSAADAERRASYIRLAAGAYEFQVRARNSAGVWSVQEPSVRFVIGHFFWQSWWFRTLVGAGLALGLISAVRRHERLKTQRKLAALERERVVERERARIARDIHDEIGTGLTQISLLADVGHASPMDLPEAEASFAQIGARARSVVRSLDEIVWAANPRNDFLPRLADYLCDLLDDCFESSPEVQCRKEVPTGLPAIVVGAELRHNLALAVKEALTNALKHGQANAVWLRLCWRDPELTVTVEDNGVGFDPGKLHSPGNGLANQVARMREVGGSVEVHSEPGKGTRSVFRVAIRTTR